tara:strand:- start:5713 stop:6087 length:375 start_codon:yes stop_codon:yes gene_type:complete
VNTRFVEKNKRRERRRKRSKTMNYYDPSRKRLVIYRSLQHIYAQIVDDPNGTTLVSVSSIEPALENELKKAKSKIEKSTIVGLELAKRAKKAKIEKVYFDRNGYLYHGRVKAVAEGAREGGLQF